MRSNKSRGVHQPVPVVIRDASPARSRIARHPTAASRPSRLHFPQAPAVLAPTASPSPSPSPRLSTPRRRVHEAGPLILRRRRIPPRIGPRRPGSPGLVCRRHRGTQRPHRPRQSSAGAAPARQNINRADRGGVCRLWNQM
jgi:hypothetical protein